MSAWKLEVRSNHPRTSFDLTYDGTQCIVRNVGSRWEMSHNGEITRLRMGSLRGRRPFGEPSKQSKRTDCHRTAG
jgi:hypothetical protein